MNRSEHWLARITRMDLMVIICFIACVCMIFSPFVLSVTMWLIPALGLFAWSPGQVWYHPRLSKRARSLRILDRDQRPFLFLIGLFFLTLLSGFQTEDWPYWWERLRIRLPFLILGISGMLLPALPARRLHAILALLVGFMTLTCIGVGIHYVLNAEQIQASMRMGHSIPVPRNHIRFSMLLAISILGGFELIRTRYQYRWSWERPAQIIASLFLLFMLHFLSVRTGILAFYGGALTIGLWYAFQMRVIWAPVAVVCGFVFLIWSGYHLLPSFKSKIDYMRYDLAMYQQGEGGQYADSGRIVSLQTGWKIFQAHPFIGIGVGNLRKEVNRIFADDYPEFVEPLTPHNQFIYVLAGMGVIGLIAFLMCFYGPFVFHHREPAPLLFGYYGLVSTTFLLEHTIENSIGTGIVIIFLLLLLLRQRLPATI
ncbi:MAG: O-antigen ligase family protein [Saprospiraceae bacterium]|nr:O-antigen ligase family protein [Saprospiraceae bacterium]